LRRGTPLHTLASTVTRVAAIVLGLCVAQAASVASAETQGEQLFREGREALARSELELACQKFQESYRVEKALGPLLNLANCEENRGRLVAARALWIDAQKLSTEGEPSRKLATERAEALEKAIPKIVVKLSPASPQETKVELDGQRVAKLDEAIAVDPGEHVVVARLADREDRKTMQAERGQSYTVDLHIDPASVKSENATAPTPEPDSSAGFIVGWTVAGVGVASGIGFGVTGAMILNASSVWKDAGCDVTLNGGCDEKQASTGLYVANAVLAGAAVVGVGVGITLLALNWPNDEPEGPSVSISPGPGDLGVLGTVRF
jgi:hypothetical protein